MNISNISLKPQDTTLPVSSNGKDERSGFQKVMDALNVEEYWGTGIYTHLKKGTPLNEAIKQRITYAEILGEEFPEASPWVTKPLGFVVSVLLSPSTYIGVGTLSKVGKAGAKTGKLAPTLAKQAKLGERSLLTFGGKSIVKGENIFKGMAVTGAKIREKAPIVDEFGALFIPGHKMKKVLNEQIPGLGDQAFNIYRKGKSTMEYSVGLERKYATELDKRIVNLADEAGVDLREAREALGEMIELKSAKGLKMPKSLTDVQRKFADMPGAQKIVAEVKERLDNMLLKEHEVGIPTAKLYDDAIDYMTHVATKPGLRWLRSPKNMTKLNEAMESLGKGKIGWAGGANPLKPEHASMIARKLREMTTKEVNEVFHKAGLKGDFFDINPALAVSVRGVRSARAIHKRQMLDSLVKEAENLGMKKLSFDDAQKLINKGESIFMPRANWAATVGKDMPVKSILKMDELVEVNKLPKDGKVFYTMEPGVAKEFSNIYKQVSDPQTVNRALKWFDSSQNWWKAWTLAPFPAYHFRNFLSNKWNNSLSGVNDIRTYIQAGRLQWKVHKGKALTKNEAEIVEQAEKLGVLGKGWYGADIPEEFFDKMRNAKWWDEVLIPGKKHVIVQQGFKVGKAIENNDRLAHFIAKVKDGYNYENAAISVKKHLFDYNELTPFEKTWMKRVFPFYTWTRKNLPLQMEYFVKNPGKFFAIARAKAAMESGEVGKSNEKYMADWMRRSAPIYLRKDPKTGNDMYFLLGGYIPAADLLKMGDPITEIASMITPLFKVPAEWLIPGGGYSFYFDSRIERIPGEPGEFLRQTRIPGTDQILTKKMIHVLRSLRLLNEIDKLLPPQTTHKTPTPLTERWVRLGTGAKLYPYDEKTAEMYYRLDIRKRVNEIKQMIRKASRKGQTEDIPIYMEKLQKEIDKLNR